MNTLGTTLLLFATSALLAMLLNPLVVRLEKRRFKRGLAVLTLVAVTLALLGAETIRVICGQDRRF